MDLVSEDVIGLLAQVTLFGSCSTEELYRIAVLGVPKSFAEGAEVVRQNEPGNEMYLVLSGHAECTANGEHVADFGPSSWFGELALLQGGFRTATVTATTDLDVLEIGARQFGELLLDEPRIAVKLLNVLAGRLRQANDALALVQ